MTQSHTPFTIDELMQMFIHWDEQSRAMFTDAEYRNFLRCLNELCDEFGRPWVEQLAGVRKTSDQLIIDAIGNDNVGDGGIGILRAIQLHEDWDAVKHCANAAKLRAKLSKVSLEVLLIGTQKRLRLWTIPRMPTFLVSPCLLKGSIAHHSHAGGSMLLSQQTQTSAQVLPMLWHSFAKRSYLPPRSDFKIIAGVNWSVPYILSRPT